MIDALDRIELRRFVGREFLLWLWFRSETSGATLSTKKHGSFGLWLEGRLVLNQERESTDIMGSAPGRHREAKEALLLGKTPERAGLHLNWGDQDVTLTLRGESVAFAGLSAPKEEKDADESFSSRMHHARDIEVLFEHLYLDFLSNRLGPTWRETLPAIEAWVRG